MKSLLLDRTAWDLSLDADRNLALCTEPYAVFQDVACAVRTWRSECWYDTALGIPYRESIFNGPAPLSVLRAQAEQAAQAVPGVAAAQCLALGPRPDRSVGGTILVTLTSGETLHVGF